MILNKDSNKLQKTAQSKVSNIDKPMFKELPNSSKRSSEENDSEDFIVKKRKFLGIYPIWLYNLTSLDEKAPGLFDHLTKFVQEEASTEAASVHSPERDSDEHKHTIHIPTPLKESNQTENSNLSGIVKMNKQKQITDPLPLPNIQGDNAGVKTVNPANNNMEIEDAQRQKILNMITYNTLMLNTVMTQQKNCQRTAMNCIESLKILKYVFCFDQARFKCAPIMQDCFKTKFLLYFFKDI